MTFRRGQKITKKNNDKWFSLVTGFELVGPKFGEVVTAGLATVACDRPAVHIDEYPNVCWDVNDFRPVTDITIFQKMLVKAPTRVNV